MRQQVFLGQVSAAGLLLTISALFYSRVFDGPGWIPPVIGAVLLSGAAAVALGRTGMGRVPRTVALVVTGLLFVLLTVILPGTSFGSGSEIASALYGSSIDGWRNTLAATLPVSTSIVEALGFITIVGWIVGSATGVLLARSEQTATPAVPSILFAALSLPLAAPTGTAGFLFIGALVASALLLTLVRAVPRSQLSGPARDRLNEFVGERMLSERLASGVPILVVLALLAPALALLLPGVRDEPFDPRRLRDEEVVTASAVNPLAELKAQREAADPAFQLTLPAPPSAVFFDRVGLVSLENYDGANWTTDATYAATAAEVGGVGDRTIETLSVRQEYQLQGGTTPWLPAGQPISRIEGNDIWYDEESGTLLNRSGSATRTYSIVSEISAPTDEQLRAASAVRTEQQYLDLPTIPPDSNIAILASQMEGASDYERLLSLEELLRNELTLVADESSGTALGRVEEFLFNQEGYRDQFVAAFAVAARQQGFPTRITVGYRIAQEADDSSLVFLDTVTSENYDAWPEVLFDGIGWVAFDPVPATSGEGGASAEDATEIPEGQPARQGPTPTADDPTEDDEVDNEDDTGSATLRLVVVSSLFFVFFPLMLLLLVVLAKILRRRYRQNIEDPTERVLAGWQESKDRLLEAGVDITPDMTVKEIVAKSRRELGVHASSSLSALAPYVTTTIYSDRPPSTNAADAVWHEVMLFDEQLSDTRTRAQNVKARVDPRPLLEKV